MKFLTFLSHAALPATVMGHIAMWHPSVYGAEDGYGHELATPLAEMGFSQWWFHGKLSSKPSEVLELPAGGSVTVELACNRKFTSMGNTNDGSNNPCPVDTPSMHAGTPLEQKQLRGCALAIAYKSDASSVDKDEFTVFSVNTDCVKDRRTTFQVPKDMPSCSGGKCICAWFWQGQNSADEMYMNGFDCNITGGSSSTKLATPKHTKFCRGDASSCVKGAKIPQYWANDINPIGFDGSYERKPAYNSDWGFTDGAQNDIFVSTGGTSPSKPVPAPQPEKGVVTPAPTSSGFATSTRSRGGSAPSSPAEVPTPAPAPEPTEKPTPSFTPTPPNAGNRPVTVVVKEIQTVYSTIYVTGAAAPTATPSAGAGAGADDCAWKGHCLGAACGSHNDCDGDLACVSGKCSPPSFAKGMRFRGRRQ